MLNKIKVGFADELSDIFAMELKGKVCFFPGVKSIKESKMMKEIIEDGGREGGRGSGFLNGMH